MIRSSPKPKTPVKSRLIDLKNNQFRQQNQLDMSIQITQPSIPHQQKEKKQQLQLPPASLMNKTVSSIYPSDIPFMSAERAWLNGNIQKLLNKKILATKNDVVVAFQLINELARHYYNFHQMPIINGNPVIDLINQQLNLSQVMYQQLLLNNFDPEKEEKKFADEKELFSKQQRVTELEGELKIAKIQAQDAKFDLTQMKFDYQQLNKKFNELQEQNRFLKQHNEELLKKVKEIEQSGLTPGSIFLSKQQPVAQKQQYQLQVGRGVYYDIQDTNENKQSHNTPVHSKRPSSAVFNALKSQKEIFTPVREPINEIKQRDQMQSQQKFTQRTQSKLGQEQSSINIVQPLSNVNGNNSVDLFIDQIPQVSKVDTTRKSVNQASYSRLKLASEAAERNDFDAVAQLTDCYQHGDNILENKYGASDIACLNDVEYNQITKDLILKRNQINEHLLQQAATRIADNFSRPADDAAWLLEQAAIASQDNRQMTQQVGESAGVSNFLHSDAGDVSNVQTLEFKLKQPASVIEFTANPLFEQKNNSNDTDFVFDFTNIQEIEQSDEKIANTAELKHPRYLNKQRTTLQAIWNVGNIRFCDELLKQLELSDNSLLIHAQSGQERGKHLMHKQSPTQIFSEYDNFELIELTEEQKNQLTLPSIFTNYYKQGTREPPSIFNLIIFYQKTVVATNKSIQYNITGLQVKPPSYLGKYIDTTPLQNYLADKDFIKDFNDNVIKKYTLYKIVQQSKHTQQDIQTIISQITPKVFGFEKIQKYLGKQQIKLYGLSELLQEFTYLINYRQALVMQQDLYNQRIHINFSQQLYQILLEKHQMLKEQSDNAATELSFSSSYWATYLTLIENQLKGAYIKVNEDDKIQADVNSAQPHLIFLFILLLNDFFSAQDTEFILYLYQTIIQCVKTNNIQIYGYVEVSTVATAVGLIFNLQNLDISVGIQQQVKILQEQLIKRSIQVGTNKLIDIGKAVQIILKTRETIIQYYMNQILKYAQTNLTFPQPANKKSKTTEKQRIDVQQQITAEQVITPIQFKKIMLFISPKLKDCRFIDQFIQTLYQQLYAQNCQPTIHNLFINSEQFMLSQGYIYDIIASYIPLYQLTRLIYSQTQKNQKVLIDSTFIDTVNVVSNLLINQGAGLNYLGQPFQFKNCKIIGETDKNLISQGHMLQESLQIYNNNLTHQTLRKLVQSLVNGCLSLKYFKFNTNNQTFTGQLAELINGFLLKNVNIHFEKECLFGIKFQEQVGIEQLLLMSENRCWETC